MGASFDAPADNKTFADAQHFGFPLLSDADHSVGRRYGVERSSDEQYPDFPKRITYLIDPAGGIAKVYEVSDIDAHADQILQDLAALDSTG